MCGIVAHWDDPVPKTLVGRQFECEGCKCWAHTDCYPRSVHPRSLPLQPPVAASRWLARVARLSNLRRYRALSEAELESGSEKLLCYACAGKK